MSFRAVLTLVILSICSSAAWGLDTGQKAPGVTNLTWLNAEPVNPAQPDGKTTYIVEFWATWCAPCKVTIPHLNKLSEKMKDRNVVIVGISDEPESKVRPFMEQMKMKYRVAVDTNRTVISDYLVGDEGIPHAFIIDTNGIVVWSGHPLDRIDAVLETVLNGSFDPKKVAALKEKEKELRQMLRAGDVSDILPKVDELLAMDPKNLNYYQIKLGLIAQGKDYDRMKRVYGEMVEAFSDSAQDLNTIAWALATSPFPMSDLAVAWKAASRAAELSQREDAAILDTLARVYYAVGLFGQAITTETEALGKALTDEERQGMQFSLDHYKSAVTVRDQITKNAVQEKKAP